MKSSGSMSLRPCNPRRVWPRRREGGAALVVALLVFALSAALLVGLQREFTLQMQRGTNTFLAEQGWAYLLGAEALGIVALRLDAQADAQGETPQDRLSEVWASEATPYPLAEGGWLLGGLEDLQGRFNLNALVLSEEGGDGVQDDTEDQSVTVPPRESGALRGEARFTWHQRQFVRLLGTLDDVRVEREQAITLMEAIADFLDSDDQRRFRGAEAEAYRNAQPPYQTANRPLASVSELRAVQGMTPEIYAALSPLVTVWPASGAPINILTAPVPVLRSLGPSDGFEPLSPADGERLVLAREQGIIRSVATLLEDIAFTEGDSGDLEAALVERSDWFLLSAAVEIADREMRLYSVLQREGESVRPRYRSRGEL